MKTKILTRFALGSLAALLLVALLAACNGGILKPTNGTVYKFKGLLVVDPNAVKTVAAVNLLKDSAPAKTAQVRLDGVAMTFDAASFAVDSVFSSAWNSTAQLSSGNHTFLASDSDLSNQTVVTTLPGTVTVTGITPTNRIANGNDQVKLDWFGGTNATTFAIAAVLRSNAYTGAGYSVYATSQTAATFPRDAFYQSNPNTPDTGWYYLYVYAIAGAPDSVLSRSILPVKLPSQLTDNISTQTLSGHVGAVRVAVRDSVHITLE